MLTFFRKNQRIFFLFITIVIIVTFVFFGTYNVLTPTVSHEETAFEAIDGKQVSSTYLDQMNRFLRSDAYEAALRSNPYKIYQGNFLNDGVIAKDFLQTGMAQVIFQQYREALYSDLQTKIDKEKHFSSYTHPYASFISAENAWESYAPNIKQNFENIKQFSDASSDAAFIARVNLYLAERSFPPALLKQVLYYQERQYDWLPQDANMLRDNLALFGYTDVQDWFGPKFVELISQIVINSAAIAKERGYKVSQNEALSDLVYRSEQAFQGIKDKGSIAAKNGYAYLQEYLRLTQLDEVTLTKIWQDVLLFRRLFNDVGSSVFVDPLTIKDFQKFAQQSAQIEVYALSQEFAFKDFYQMQLFEVYLDAIAEKDRDPLILPQSLKRVEVIENEHPELVERRYWVEIAHVNKNALQSQISVKETWDWEVKAENFEKLKQKYPDLAIHQVTSDEKRFDILERLDARTRQLIDYTARESIVNEHPEWVQKALEDAIFNEEILALGNEKSSLEGVTKIKKLCELLDHQNENEVTTYSEDQIHFYKIKIKEKPKNANVLTFNEASQKGILEKMLKKEIEKNPEAYSNVLTAIQVDCKKRGINLTLDQKNELASYRFYAYINEICEKIKNKEINFEQVIALEDQTSSLIEKPSLLSQWKAQKTTDNVSRSQNHSMNFDEMISFQNGDFSSVCHNKEKGAYFYQFLGFVEQTEEISKQLKEYQELLASEAKCNALKEYLSVLNQKEAICLR